MPLYRDYVTGDRLVDCDECGFTYRISEVRKGIMGKQKGLTICGPCFDPVHPNEASVPHRREGQLREIV